MYMKVSAIYIYFSHLNRRLDTSNVHGYFHGSNLVPLDNSKHGSGDVPLVFL